jgi:hypothetical protein
MMLNTGAGLIATLETALALVFAAALIFAFMTAGERARSRTRTIESVTFMRALEEDVRMISRDEGGMKYAGQLRRISEAIKYSDYSGLASMDADLAEKIRELKYVLRDVGESLAERVNPPGVAGQSGALDDERIDKQVELITEDIIRLTQDRNHELINIKRNRSLSNG